MGSRFNGFHNGLHLLMSMFRILSQKIEKNNLELVVQWQSFILRIN